MLIYKGLLATKKIDFFLTKVIVLCKMERYVVHKSSLDKRFGTTFSRFLSLVFWRIFSDGGMVWLAA